MPKLRCSVGNCSYHYDCYCTKDKIKIDCKKVSDCDMDDTNCDSYKKRSLRNSVLTTEFAKFDIPHENQEISCDSIDCFHNCEKVCCAKKVSIIGHDATKKDETECASYIKNDLKEL